MISIGERIKQLRNEKGMSQDDLTRILDIKNRSTLASWETDKSRPDYENLAKMASFFNVTTDYLLGMVNDKGEKAQINFKLIDGREIGNLNDMMKELDPKDQQLIVDMMISLAKKAHQK